MTKQAKKGIFCLEGDWDYDLKDKTSVEPILKLLETSNFPNVPYIRRDIGTTEEFYYYLKKWTQKRHKEKHPFLYFGFHGKPGEINVSNRKIATIEDIGKCLKSKCKDAVIIFASCSTINIDSRHLKSFLNITEAKAVCGYKKSVDWIDATAFELLLLSNLQVKTFTKRRLEIINKNVKENYQGLVRNLKFSMKINPKS